MCRYSTQTGALSVNTQYFLYFLHGECAIEAVERIFTLAILLYLLQISQLTCTYPYKIGYGLDGRYGATLE